MTQVTTHKTDIQNFSDIQLLVNNFYGRIQADELLGPIFNAVIQNNWPQHLEKMYTFWNTVLFSEPGYTGSPFPPHAKLPIDKLHFDHWLSIFKETVNENFAGVKADEAIWRGERMAEMFNFKLEHFKQSGNKFIQ
ncbi:group III truncated hemoglobin [Solitalea lacus]|uniref:group III truncated hemoglobin n=1 Tax=Solitalea lacus TaxID=2911172 RepID=UPI001EDA2766|nr:group III truncated hemoglobin [Solitalea lacus]UKJ06841.1 group III truncated hemoglobin [Solitalea lacus]